ncbi:Transmembrane protease serine 9 [Papilio machaon]|uniref:Transmembrane protease serine 9 n=1 Tax=Papilio machaon TaxID=76193 RepID=A0A194QL10_PAPMA|nr:Transmembrane protease serine 9 [Papilio machaon]
MWCWIFIWALKCLSSLQAKIIVSETVPVNNAPAASDPVDSELNRPQARIVGGFNSTCTEFPHQVSYIVNNSYFCGGFIVSERFILTAAHCAQNVDPSTVVLRAGSTFRTNGTIIPIIEVIPNPEYDNPPLDKDIAVMKTAEAIQFDSCIQPIALPPKGLIARAGNTLLVSGWGRTEQDATTIPLRLMAVNLTVVDRRLCQATYFLEVDITRNMLCAGNFFLGGESTCQGDSGGVGAIDGVARAIVSFGRGCGQPLSPAVFTDISAPTMRDFITQYTEIIQSERVALRYEAVPQSNKTLERIVGGHLAACEEFPHQVSYVVNNSYFCGGFIISNRFILTAAHCAQNVVPSTVLLRSGSTFRKNGTVIPIAEVIAYPGYNRPPFDKDIAVMRTSEDIKFNSCTQPIALPAKGSMLRAGTPMTVSGWGRTRQGASTLPDRLMAVDLNLVSRSRCQSAYNSLRITENMLCAGNYFFGGKSTCQGDSGGVGAIDGVARGVVSFGRGCGQRLSPSVFANLAAPNIRDFIKTHTGL